MRKRQDSRGTRPGPVTAGGDTPWGPRPLDPVPRAESDETADAQSDERPDLERPESSDHGARPRPLRAVTFDVTQTLIHAPRLPEIYTDVLRRHDAQIGLAAVRSKIPLVWQEMSCLAQPSGDRFGSFPGGARGFWHRFVERLYGHLEIGEPTRFVSSELFDRFAHAEAWELYPDVPATLEGLRAQGLRLGIVSNWDDRLPDLLAEIGLLERFDSVVYSSRCGIEKPNPKIFLACLEELEVEPAAALHVGDDPLDDVEGADAAGMRALRIDPKARGDLWNMLQPLVAGSVLYAP